MPAITYINVVNPIKYKGLGGEVWIWNSKDIASKRGVGSGEDVIRLIIIYLHSSCKCTACGTNCRIWLLSWSLGWWLLYYQCKTRWNALICYILEILAFLLIPSCTTNANSYENRQQAQRKGEWFKFQGQWQAESQ